MCRRAWKTLHGMGHLACSLFFTAEKVVLVDSLSRLLCEKTAHTESKTFAPLLGAWWLHVNMFEHVLTAFLQPNYPLSR